MQVRCWGTKVTGFTELAVSYCTVSVCLYLLGSGDLCSSLAFPMADFNRPGTVERWRVAVWKARTEDGSPGAPDIPTTQCWIDWERQCGREGERQGEMSKDRGREAGRGLASDCWLLKQIMFPCGPLIPPLWGIRTQILTHGCFRPGRRKETGSHRGRHNLRAVSNVAHFKLVSIWTLDNNLKCVYLSI